MRKRFAVQVGVGLFLAAAVLPITPTIGATGPAFYQGTIFPAAAIETEGSLYLPPSHAFLATWSAPHERPSLQAHRLRLTIEEWKWTSAQPADLGRPPRADAPRTTTETLWNSARIEQVRAGADNEWSLDARGDAALLGAGMRGCAVTPGEATLGDILQYSNMLNVKCGHGILNVTFSPATTQTIRVFDAELLAQGTPVGSDRIETRVLHAGLFTSRNVSRPLYDNVLRQITLTPTQDVHSTSFVVGARGVRLQTPLIQLVGDVSLPPFIGKLQVGDEMLTNTTHSTRLRGAFVLFANGEHRGFGGVGIGGSSERNAATVAPFVERGPPHGLVVAASLGALGLLSAMATWLAARPGLLGVGLFSRLTRLGALEHDLRRSLKDLVDHDAGVRLHEAAKALGVPPSTLIHHIKILQQQRILSVHKEGHRTSLFPADARGAAAVQAFARRPIVRRVLDALPRDRPVSQADIAEMLGISQSYLSRILRRLETHGLVQRTRVADGTAYRHPLTRPPGWDRPNPCRSPAQRSGWR